MIMGMDLIWLNIYAESEKAEFIGFILNKPQDPFYVVFVKKDIGSQ